MSKQDQVSGDNSTNIQANHITINNGLSLEEAKKVALDVFDANFYRLSEGAMEIARKRAQQVTNEFLEKLQKENPSGLAKARDPDFQYSLLNVQKEHAKSGDPDLSSLLVDLLVERSKTEKRDLKSIVLNESIKTAPLLTQSQLALLAIIFLFRYTQNNLIDSHESLGLYFDKHIMSYLEKLDNSYASLQHLEYSGCGTNGFILERLEVLILRNYQGLFMRGFDRRVIDEKSFSFGLDSRFFAPCLNNSNLYQLKFLNKKNLKDYLAKDCSEITDNEKKIIIELFDTERMQEQDVMDKCISIRSYMKRVFDLWNMSRVGQFTLTSVGMAIGHANIERYVGRFPDIDIWLK